MKKIIFSFIFLLSIIITKAQTVNKYYAVAFNFSSKCCGVPDNKPLLDAVMDFKNKNKLKEIVYDRIGPLGKEGEYKLGFYLLELNKKQKVKFISLAKKITEKLNVHSDNNSAGSVNMEVKAIVVNKENLGRAGITVEKI
jgi:hypothetical protein